MIFGTLKLPQQATKVLQPILDNSVTIIQNTFFLEGAVHFSADVFTLCGQLSRARSLTRSARNKLAS